jgi:precorrin-6Y C5,15-methyltransferase (decarboxylating)
LITKDEVRAATIQQLRLPRDGVFWDVGAGSGSVSVAAGILNPNLQVYALERHPDELANIKANIIKHKAFNVQVIEGAAPDILAGLPEPDRVFIGGSGGRLKDILNHCVPRLVPAGRIVVNSVLEKTASEAPVILHALGLKVDLRQISVRRWNYGEETKQQLNPITLITGTK